MSPIDDTFGAAYIGIVVAGFLLGVSGIQAWYYFTHQKDRWPLCSLVAAVVVFDVAHQILITHTGYIYLITWFEDPKKLVTIVWSLLVEVLFNGLTAFSVQSSFLTYRIWKLSGTRIWLPAVVVLFVFGEFACVTAFAIIALFRVKTFEQLAAELKGLSITVNALAAAGDLMIAGILTLLLQRSKTGFRRSDTMINKLTLFAVNTGALTSLCAVASLISILAAPNTFIYISFFFSIGRLYTNSLLATLNARKMIRKAADDLQTHTTTMMSECHGNEGLENDDDDDDVDVEEYENGDGEEEAKRRSDGLGEDSGVARKVARRRKRVRASTRRRAESRLIFHRAKSFTFGTTGNDGNGRNGTGNGMGNNIDISIQVDTTREYISDGRIGYRKSLVQAHHHHHHRQADMAVLRSAPASLSDIDMDSEILGRDSTRMTTTEVEDGDYRFMEEEEEGGDLGEVGLSDSMARSIKSFLSITTGSGGHIEGHAV